MKKQNVFDFFKNIQDPRKGKNISYPAIDIILITILAVISGANTWEQIELFGKSKKEMLKKKFNLKKDIPSHDTFNRFFSILNPIKFKNFFRNWTNHIKKNIVNDIIPIDGKTLRRSFDKNNEKSAIHVISAWSNLNNIVLGQLKVDAKTNEITQIPKLLELLDIKNKIITIDAMGNQKNISNKIKEKKGDYVLAVKDNQPRLKKNISNFFKVSNNNKILNGFKIHEDEETYSHGRGEKRTCKIFELNNKKLSKEIIKEWKHTKTIIEIESQRLINNELHTQKRWYHSSIKTTPKEFLKIIRTHWEIENKLHWVLDIGFREDEDRKRNKNSAENFNVIRHIVFNLFSRYMKKQNKNLSIKTLRLLSGWSDDFLLSLFQ